MCATGTTFSKINWTQVISNYASITLEFARIVITPAPESTTTRAAGGLDFTAIGGARSAPIAAGGTGCASMTIPLYERDGLEFSAAGQKNKRTSVRNHCVFVRVHNTRSVYKQPHGLKTTNEIVTLLKELFGRL